jgi:hypothetical protein
MLTKPCLDRPDLDTRGSSWSLIESTEVLALTQSGEDYEQLGSC